VPTIFIRINMNSESKNPQSIDLREIINVLWNKKIKIILFSAFFSTFSIFYSLSIPDEYRASAVLISSTLNESSLNPSQPGLASGNFIGKSLGLSYLEGISPETKIALEIMTSWGFLENYISKYELSPSLIAAEGWDKSNNKIIFNEKVFNSASNSWVDSSYPKRYSSMALYKKLKERINITVNSDTAFITVSVDFFSPFVAKDWLEKLIVEINDHMRKRNAEKAKTNLIYLQKAFSSSNEISTRNVISSLIKEQINKQMVSEASPNYSFVYISKLMAPEKKFKPKRSIIVILISLFGLFITSVYFVTLSFYRK